MQNTFKVRCKGIRYKQNTLFSVCPSWWVGVFFTSFTQVPQRPEDRVGDFAFSVEKGGQTAAGLVGMLHLGPKLIHDVPHWDPLLGRLHNNNNKHTSIQ